MIISRQRLDSNESPRGGSFLFVLRCERHESVFRKRTSSSSSCPYLLIGSAAALTFRGVFPSRPVCHRGTRGPARMDAHDSNCPEGTQNLRHSRCSLLLFCVSVWWIKQNPRGGRWLLFDYSKLVYFYHPEEILWKSKPVKYCIFKNSFSKLLYVAVFLQQSRYTWSSVTSKLAASNLLFLHSKKSPRQMQKHCKSHRKQQLVKFN